MKKKLYLLAPILLIFASNYSISAGDNRQLVKLPDRMQQHMLANMRDHLETINKILILMSNDRLDEASNLAESRLGMSSLELHHASQMAKFMPEGMRKAGTNMHHAASQFALKVEEGDLIPAYKALTKVTSACVACHSSYRIH